MREKKPGLASFVLIGLVLASIFAGAVSGAGVGEAEEGIDNITIEEAEEMLNSRNVVVLDVRSQAEYESGHIAGAKLITVSELEGGIDELDKGKNIIVYCGSGGRSAKASEILVKYGFEDVYCMLGGITAWIDAGLPTTSFPNSQTPLLFMPNNNSLSSEIDDILADESVFLFFYADWCHFCRQQMPIIDQLEEEYAEKLAFIHINVTERPDYAEEFGVSALPTMFVISDKKGERYAKEEISGFTEQTRLREIIALGREDGSDDVGNGANENQDPADKDGDISAMARQPVQPLEPMAPVDTATTARVDEHLIVLEDGRDGVTVTAKNCGGTTTCACGDTVTSDYTLEADLDCDCGSLGLKVGANGIHIDGNGHAITGPTGVEFSWGIDNNVGKDYVTISNLTIVGFVTGIRLYGAANHNKIRDNSIATCDTGISLVDSTDNEITYNYIHNNNDGIAISGGSSNTIRRNTIDINTHYGIHLRGYPAGTSGNTVSSNAVCGNVEKDIVVSSESTGNHGNNFCDDLTASGNAITCSKSCDERGCVADAHPTTVFTCGDTVTESCTFNSDLYCSLSNGLTVGADDVTIDGDGYRLINHFCLSHWQPSGIKNDGHNNGAVMHLTVKKFYRGIYLYSHADGNKIKCCTIDDNGYGVYISNSKNNQLLPIIREPLPPKYNYIVNNGKGIYLSDADDNLISHSYINDNRVEGISVYTSDDNRIEDSHINDNGYYGIYISYADDNRVEDNTIKNNGDDGIYMEYSEDNIVSDNQITQNNMHGVYIYSSSYNTITDNTANTNDGKGIYLNHSSDNNILTDNTANSNDAGIYLDQSDNNVLIDNIANWNKYGFVLYNASRNTLTGNTASSNRYHGIQLSHVSNNNNIINNQIGNSVYQHGVYIAYSNNTLIQDNEISKNDDYGLYFFCANYNIVSNNTINDNKYGIYLGSYSSHNLINVNRIIKNRNGIYFYSSAFSFPRNTTISNNYICNNKNKDIINNPLGSNIGWLNYCDTVSNWDDSSSSGGCMYSCGELNCTDNDGDGYPIFDIFECPIGNDCDDNNASINPGADEIYCNDRDEDCNAVYECSCPDNDDDGAPALTDTCPLGFDCDDSDPNRYPGAREINCNGIDENCDGEDQCECTDNDGDGYAIEGGDCGLGGEVDCNDEDINIHPNAAEIYCNGVDEDCSGSDDCNCVDNDCDGYYLRNAYYCPTGTDCDDVRDYIHPGRAEICYNYIDENCNGMIDEGCNISCYTDDDCSDGRICAEDNICRCPNGELDFLVDGDVITVCDPIGVPVDTPCEHGWPHHEGSNVDYNEEVPACDLFEVTGKYDLFTIVGEARDCCVSYFENGVVAPGCHGNTERAYRESGLDTALNYDNLRRCIGLYEIYSHGGRRQDMYMQDYYDEEIDCGADTIWGVRRDSCLGRAPGTPGTSGDLNYCCNIDEYEWKWCWGICWPECWGGFHPAHCDDGVHANTALLRCRWDDDQTPNGWVSDTDISANDCCFSDLPAHASVSFLSTGTCVDYSVVLTTLLRMSGYKADEVYSTRSDCPDDMGHCFNLIKLPGDSNYTLVDTVGNCVGYHPMALPGCTGCYYCSYENCANDNGQVDCPPRTEVWGCEEPVWHAAGGGGFAAGASVPPNPTLNSVSATEGGIAVTRTVYDEIYIGEIVRVNITVENDNDYAVNVTVRDSIAGAIVYGDLNIPEIPAGIIAPPMPYVEFSDTVAAHGEKSFAYSLLPEFVGHHIHSATEVRTDNGLIYLDSQTTEVNCISDGVCNGSIGENYITCPQDCWSGAEDGICNPIADGQCDNDCVEGLDPDCQCVTPTDDLYINSDTTLCPGFYDIPDAGADGVIIINADDVVLDCNGATINGIGSGYGIYNYGFDNVSIKNGNVMNYRYGIQVRTYADHNVISNNTVTSNTIAGIELFGSAKYNTITNNTANSNGWGIYLVLNADNNIVVNNTASSNGVDGIRMEDSSCGNMVRYNIANSNTANGIHLESSSDRNELVRNVVSSNEQNGIHLRDRASNNMLANNSISDNANYGVYFTSDSTDNYVSGNILCSNLIDIYDEDANSGDENRCDTTHNWNDTRTTGCTYTCAAVPPTCSDGTPYGKCNPSKKPKYCDNGTLIDNCNLCGCDAGLSCNTTSGICYAIPAGDNCTCSTCAECVAKLNDPSCSVVTLTADITKHCGTCITDPANFTNKIFDCQGHIIDGAGYDHGIFLSGKSGNTIKNCVITDFDEGIRLEWGAKNNTIMNSTISSNDYGIYIIAFSNGNTIVDNNILDNNQAGVVISDCESGGYCPGGNTNNTLQGNLIVNNSIGIYSNGSTSIIKSNVVCGNTNQDFYSSDWQLSSGDNNTCDCADGWNEDGTTGCSKSCLIQYPDTFSFLVAHIDLEEPRWDPDDPNLIWGVDEFSIKTVNVSTGQTTVIEDFSRDPILGPIIAHENVYRITMKDEGESSRDKR